MDFGFFQLFEIPVRCDRRDESLASIGERLGLSSVQAGQFSCGTDGGPRRTKTSVGLFPVPFRLPPPPATSHSDIDLNSAGDVAKMKLSSVLRYRL